MASSGGQGRKREDDTSTYVVTSLAEAMGSARVGQRNCYAVDTTSGVLLRVGRYGVCEEVGVRVVVRLVQRVIGIVVRRGARRGRLRHGNEVGNGRVQWLKCWGRMRGLWGMRAGGDGGRGSSRGGCGGRGRGGNGGGGWQGSRGGGIEQEGVGVRGRGIAQVAQAGGLREQRRVRGVGEVERRGVVQTGALAGMGARRWIVVHDEMEAETRGGTVEAVATERMKSTDGHATEVRLMSRNASTGEANGGRRQSESGLGVSLSLMSRLLFV